MASILLILKVCVSLAALAPLVYLAMWAGPSAARGLEVGEWEEAVRGVGLVHVTGREGRGGVGRHAVFADWGAHDGVTLTLPGRSPPAPALAAALAERLERAARSPHRSGSEPALWLATEDPDSAERIAAALRRLTAAPEARLRFTMPAGATGSLTRARLGRTLTLATWVADELWGGELEGSPLHAMAREDEDPRVRRSAWATLLGGWKRGPTPAAPALVDEAVGSDDPFVAALGAVHLDGDDGRAARSRLLADPALPDLGARHLLLAAWDEATPDVLLAQLARADDGLLAAACTALGQRGDTACLPSLRRLSARTDAVGAAARDAVRRVLARLPATPGSLALTGDAGGALAVARSEGGELTEPGSARARVGGLDPAS
jgi:hypothetical protein